MLPSRTRSLALAIAKKNICAEKEKAYINDCDRLENGNFQKDVVGAEALKKGLLGGHPPIYHLPLPPRRFARGKMAYRSIDDSFWLSPKVRQLSTEEKLLYLYLISVATNAGFVRTIPEIIAVTVGIETGRIGGLLGALRDAGRVVWEPENNLIWVVGQIDHQTMAKGGGLDFYKARGLENECLNLAQGIIRQEFEKKYGRLIKDTLTTGPKRPLNGASTPPPIKERKGNERKGNEIKEKECGRQKTPTAPHPDFQNLVEQIHQTWFTKFQAKPNWNGKDGANLKTLLTRNPKDLIFEAWQLYLAEPDEYCQRNGQSFTNFCGSFDKLVSRLAQHREHQAWLEEK